MGLLRFAGGAASWTAAPVAAAPVADALVAAGPMAAAVDGAAAPVAAAPVVAALVAAGTLLFCVFLLTFYPYKTDINVPSKSNKQKNVEKINLFF